MKESRKSRLEKEVKETLNLLETLPQETMRPGFYGRLNYRINHPETVQQSALIQLIRTAGTPALAAACVLFGIFLSLKPVPESGTGLDILMETYDIHVSETPQLTDFNGE